ncbi:MAG TPA: hypothetical protein VES42_10975, partial [Pilimelia sp.]|nr:hypothetical protein [Pilimelia sp.]
MGRHRSHRAAPRWVLPTAGAAAVALVIALTVNTHGGDRDTAAPPAPTPAAACDTVVRVLTASSFLPVLDALGPRLGSGADCVS